MFRRFFGSVLFVVATAVLVAAICPVEAMPLLLKKPAGCGLCTKDDDCGTGHKCCKSNCPTGEKKCLMVTTCP
jgi:hypothetical protein